MAGTAGAGSAAGAFHLEVVGLRYVEEIVAVAYREGVGVGVFVDDGYFAFLAGEGRVEVAVLGGGCGGEGPGEGGEGWSSGLLWLLRSIGCAGEGASYAICPAGGYGTPCGSAQMSSI